MLTEQDIIIKQDAGGTYWQFAAITAPVRLFGKLRFEQERVIKLSAPKDMNILALLPQINDYLIWLASDDCEAVLAAAYIEKNQWSLNEYCDGKLPVDWYKTLALLGATITIAAGCVIGLQASLGDNVFEDHILCVEFSDRQITELYYDG